MVPLWLEWTDVAISVAAFAVAVVSLPAAFQMWWGAPEIRVKFLKINLDPGIGLECEITNGPIDNWFLKILKVRRETACGVGVKATIRKSGGGAVKYEERVNIKVDGNNREGFQQDLAAGVPAYCTIVFQSRKEGGIYLTQNRDGTGTLIEPGEYECEIVVSRPDDPRHSIAERRTFFCSRSIDETMWGR